MFKKVFLFLVLGAIILSACKGKANSGVPTFQDYTLTQQAYETQNAIAAEDINQQNTAPQATYTPDYEQGGGILSESDVTPVASSGDCPLKDDWAQPAVKWCDYIVEASNKYEAQYVTPQLIAGVIVVDWQVTGGDPSFASEKIGAVGLMLVVPSDMESVNAAHPGMFAKRPTTEKLQDPRMNILEGSYLLARRIQDTGNIYDALVRYTGKESQALKVWNLINNNSSVGQTDSYLVPVDNRPTSPNHSDDAPVPVGLNPKPEVPIFILYLPLVLR